MTSAAEAEAGERGLQISLALAGAGALLVLLGLFGTVAGVVGLGLMVAGTVLSAPYAPERGWWGMLATGAAISVAAALIQIPLDTLGGLLAVLGGVLVLVAAALGLPLRRL